MNRRYPPEMQDFVRQMATERVPNSEMARRCNEKFNLARPVSASSITFYKSHYGIVNAPRYTKEFIDALRELVKTHTIKEATGILEERFKLGLGPTALKGLMIRLGISTGRTGRFTAGHIPANKGREMSEEVREKVCRTWFRKGHKSINSLPVGTEVFRDGYVLLKLRDGAKLKQWGRWVLKHRYVWEQAHGPIPEGMLVVFLDGNTRNCELSNLALVSKEENVIMNTKKLRSQNAQATKVAITVAKLNLAISRKGKKHGNSD